MSIALTWWGHASVTIELAGLRVALDPLFSSRLGHLRRHVPLPDGRASDADVILISHMHGDHLHLASLRRFAEDVPIIVPRGAGRLLRRLANPFMTVTPGDEFELAMGARVQVTGALHDGRRHPGSPHAGPALGFRVHAGDDLSFWYPGDTGLHPNLDAVEPVNLAVVPVGGWGPSLGEEHLDPLQAVEAVSRVGARRAVPVHYGTYWPLGMTLARRTHRHLFMRPATRFAEQMAEELPGVEACVPLPGDRVVWP